MELHWPHASSGRHGAAGEGFSIGDSKATKILERNPEDDFECTYFRQRPKRTPTKESNQQAKKSGGLFPMTIGYGTLASELSDGYTDSESESDNTSNVERWLESLPANDAWSSTPNYLALDGSEGLEGVDEIQEDSNKIPDYDSEAFSTSINDSKKSSASKTEDSELRTNGNNRAERTSTGRDETSATSKWIDRQTPHKKMERTLKMRRQIPLWTVVERKARIVIAKENFLERKSSGKADTYSLVSETDGGERNVSIYEKAVCNSLETTERKMSGKKLSFGEDAYNEMMQEMAHGLLSASACNEDGSTRDRIVEKSGKESLSELCGINESRETIDGGCFQLGMKRGRLTSTCKNLSPKLAKTKINENHLLKRKRIQAFKAVTKKAQKQNPKLVRKISQGRTVLMHQQVKPAGKLRCGMMNLPSVEDIDSGKTEKRLKRFPQARTVRFQDEVTVGRSAAAWRQAAVAKAARNKQILQTIEQIVDNIGDEEEEEKICEDPGEARRMLSSISGPEDCKDSVELKICRGSWSANRKRPMKSIENKTIGSRKPMFTNPFVENCLDKAMDVALSKYKCPQNTWEDFVKEKTREKMFSAAYEPPAKKLKPKSFTTKTEDLPRQDFSLLNSWQSVHNHFLLYSLCK